MIIRSDSEVVGNAYEVIDWVNSKLRSWHEQGKDSEPVFTAKLRKRKRTLTQNAYYWVLVGKLAAKVRLSHNEVHEMMIRSYGAYDVFTVREDVPLNAYFKYYDIVGSAWMNGANYRHVRVFKGSSEMDSAEFSRLIDGMRQECEQQGIEVMTPTEIAALKYVEGAA